jgi:hypothetical protein
MTNVNDVQLTKEYEVPLVIDLGRLEDLTKGVASGPQGEAGGTKKT